jgi:predicted transcriptional regulator
MSELRVRHVMTREVVAVAPDTSLLTTARLFAVRHITGAPVIDKDGRPVGVVTQTDLVDPERDRTSRPGKSVYYHVTGRTTAMHGDDAVSPDGVVADVMSPFILAVDPEATLLDAARRMVVDDVHRLLVLEDGKLAGIVTSMDVLRAIVHLSPTA